MGFIDGLFNIASQAITNRTNARTSAADRKFQNFMFNKQASWAERMYEKQRLDNLPSTLMQQRRDAGLNPYLTDASMGSVAVPSAPSPSVPSSHASQAAHFQGMDDELMNSIRMKFDIRKAEAETNLISEQADSFHLDNAWKEQFNSQKFKETARRIALMDVEKDTANFNLSRAMKMEPYELQNWQNTVRIQEIEHTKLDLEKQMLEHSLPYVVPQKRAELARIAQEIKESKQRAKLYKAQRKTEKVKEEDYIQSKESKRLDNLLKSFSEKERAEIKQYIIGKYYIDSRQSGFVGSGISVPNFINAAYHTP